MPTPPRPTPSLPPLPTLEDQISADPVQVPDLAPNNSSNDDNLKTHHFISRCNPGRMGQIAPIAYGGNTIALAVHAAHQTLPPVSSHKSKTYNLFSILCTFHSGAKADRKLHLSVTSTRDTRTFATRRIIATQTQDDGSTRTCIELTADFHMDEATFLSYNVQPRDPSVFAAGPIHPTRTKTSEDRLRELLDSNTVTERAARGFRAIFREAEHQIDFRHAYPSVSGVNLLGLAPQLATEQDHLPTPEKTSYEWVRIMPKYTPPETSPFSTQNTRDNPSLSAAALPYIMDQAISFMPLNHTHRGFEDSSACSSLEFALRIFVPTGELELEGWHLRERMTNWAGLGRTFSEGRLWDGRGRLVCGVSQCCILRGRKEEVREGEGRESKM